MSIKISKKKKERKKWGMLYDTHGFTLKLTPLFFGLCERGAEARGRPIMQMYEVKLPGREHDRHEMTLLGGYAFTLWEDNSGYVVHYSTCEMSPRANKNSNKTRYNI